MGQDDGAYFLIRAEQERERAEQAAGVEARRVHELLAARYARLGKERRRTAPTS